MGKEWIGDSRKTEVSLLSEPEPWVPNRIPKNLVVHMRKERKPRQPRKKRVKKIRFFAREYQCPTPVTPQITGPLPPPSYLNDALDCPDGVDHDPLLPPW